MHYELLTGKTPFDRKRLRDRALDETLRIIREEESSLLGQAVITGDYTPLVSQED